MNTLHAWIVLASLATTAPSQFYWPAAYATVRGNAVLNTPFSVMPGQPTTRTRCMVVLHPSAIPFPIGTTLTQLSLRRDVGHPNAAYQQTSGSLRVRLGRAVAAPRQIADVQFERLWDGIPTMVVNRTPQSPFVVPAAPAPGLSLPPFQVVIPFTTNFVWQGGPLAIEFLFTPTTGFPTWRLDAVAIPDATGGTSVPAGTGCVGSNGFVALHHLLPETALPGMTMKTQMEGSKLPANAGAFENLAFHMLGLQNALWQGMSLPVSLGTFGGPPPCLLRVDPLFTFTVTTTNPSAMFARATSSVVLPAHPGLVGVMLYSQWMLFDSGVSAGLAVTTSDAIKITLGQVANAPAVRAARTIWKDGATGYGLDSGRMVLDDYGPVLKFN